MLQSIRQQLETTERYERVQHLVHVKTPKRPMPSQALLDRVADEKMTGNYRLRLKNGQNNVCTECFETKSVNGSCGCTE